MINRFKQIVIVITLVCINMMLFAKNKPTQELYQLTVYQYTNLSQEVMISDYLKNALLPTLHKMGYKNIGVFKSLANDTSAVKKIFVFLHIKNLDEVLHIDKKLNSDTAYTSAGAAYLNTPYSTPAYSRMETIFLKAFPLAPTMNLPQLKNNKSQRVYELRSYESATEKIHKNKVHMFNEGDEIGLFKKLNFNAVFYSQVIAGSHMPNLMYMTCFENKEDREAHWKSFGSHAIWQKLKSLPEYQNNVSHIDINFLQPFDWSDF